MTLKYGLDGRRGFVSTMAGELIPLQSSLIRGDAFHRVEVSTRLSSAGKHRSGTTRVVT